jgi:predicted polyphosphate/ATP-dependent NAD kinase
VGIIANPASGADIRRLVALGTLFGTQEKINIVRRALVGLDATGIERIYMMPDVFGIGRTALARLPTSLASLRERAHVLDSNLPGR